MIEVLRLIVKVFFGIFYRVEIKGTDNIPETGAAILCSNHLGEMDMFFIGYRIKRLIRWMAKEELFKIPVVGFLIRWLGAFPVKRGKADVDSVKTALRLLSEGHIVGIFPEGTRTRGKPDKKANVKRGAVMIALRANVPVVPVLISGSYKPFSKVKIVFGKPFKLDLEENKKYTGEEMVEIARSIMEKIYSLQEEK